MRILAIDYGEKKLGLAMGDTETKVASPFGILANNDQLIAELKTIIQTEEINQIVLGLPRYLDGKDTDFTPKVQAFKDVLEAELLIEIIEYDERLSSRISEQLVGKKGQQDDVAVMVFLQDYLTNYA